MGRRGDRRQRLTRRAIGDSRLSMDKLAPGLQAGLYALGMFAAIVAVMALVWLIGPKSPPREDDDGPAEPW